VSFYFRKSVRLGGFRLNLSKSGLGYSYGVKGFRISTGQRGTYATTSAGGFYYRERIDKPVPRSPGKQKVIHEPVVLRRPEVIETADVSQLVDSSSERVVSEINGRKSKMRITPVLVSFCIIVIVALLVAEAFMVTVVLFVCAIPLTLATYRFDQQRRTTSLLYELEGEAASRFSQLKASCRTLSKSQMAWRVESNQATWDWKRNAGASSLITRRQIKIGHLTPPCIETNIEAWGIDVGNLKLYFFPDRLFVEQDGRYGAVPYEALHMECSPSRFIENGIIPRDAQVVDHTWQYVKKDGGPDRRFSNNRQLPIALYAHLEVKSTTGLNVHLQVSNIPFAQEFSAFFTRLEHKSDTQRNERSYRNPHASGRTPEASEPVTQEKSPREVLGVSASATIEEITEAYRRIAQMYHPDKVMTLAPEFRELAERKMKEINIAYQLLKKTR
jgi:hypothetical protein